MSRVLIAEDDLSTLDFIASTIRRMVSGCKFDLAQDGLSAYELAKINNYDLIITDHRMPIMSGKDFVMQLRSGDELNSRTPVVFLSGYLDDFEDEVKSTIPTILLEKPLYEEHLKVYIGQFLGSPA